MMKKRIISVIVLITIVLSLLSVPVTATINSSAYIFSVTLGLSQGDNTGQIKLNYSVFGMGIMNTIGIFKIDVYNASGSKYKTVYGSIANGLLKSNTNVAAGTYIFNCVAGNTYYCEVTVYAGNSTGSDMKTYTTKKAVAKPST